MRAGAVFVAVVMVFEAVALNDAVAQRALPEDNLAYPVLVTTSEGSGTGFFLASDETVYFVTARHVVYKKPQTGEPKPDRVKNLAIAAFGRDPKDTTQFTADLDLGRLDASNNLLEDSIHDVVVISADQHEMHRDQPHIDRASLGRP
jgi:hypothetical protein